MNPKPPPRPLKQHDWDFSAFQDDPRLQDELPVCCRYEYCRESRLRDFAEQLAEALAAEIVASGPGGARQRLRQVANRISSDAPTAENDLMLDAKFTLAVWFSWCGGDVPGFPDEPWLDIEPQVRRKYLNDQEALKHDFGFGLRVETKTDLEWTDWKRRQQLSVKGKVCGWFAIPPGLTRKQVSTEFAAQLCAQHPDLFAVKKGGRSGPADMLKQLGALRVLVGRTPGAAADYMKQHGGDLYTYDGKMDAGSWVRARTAARERLNELDQLASDLINLARKVFSPKACCRMNKNPPRIPLVRGISHK